jgi:hypothetical protein
MENELHDALLERVRGAAFNQDAESRAWEAVRTAALLRKDARHEPALVLLDDVVDRFRDGEIEVAAYACAVAIHCDRGEPAVGVKVGRPVWERKRGVELGNALVRAYWECFEQTGIADDRDAWVAFQDELDAVRLEVA